MNDSGEKNVLTGTEIIKKGQVTVLFDNLGNESTSDQTILKLNDHKNQKNKSCALIIPGIEGMAGNNIFNLAKNLCMEAFALQLNLTSKQPNIKALADEAFESVVLLYKSYNTFFLVGYSFGGLVAIELAKRFERMQIEGHVVLLDSSPLFCQRSVEEQLGLIDPIYANILENKLQMLVITSIMQMISPLESSKLQNSILECSSWEECIETLVEFSDNKLAYSNFYLKNIMNALVSRLTMLQNLDLDSVDPLKRTPITLIRPKLSLANIDENYGLLDYTKKKLTVTYVAADHVSMLKNSELHVILKKLYIAAQDDKTFY